MVYMGSKKKIRRQLLPYILRDRKPGQAYVEPFLGGSNMMEIVPGANRIGNDLNYYVIEMWKALQNGWQPPMWVSKEDYMHIRRNKEKYPPQLVGFVGSCCAAFGTWFHGYAQIDGVNFATRGHKVLLQQIQKLTDVKLYCRDYRRLDYPDNSIIYCDPPYDGVSEYDGVPDFDTDNFWPWAREMSRDHSVYVSEYKAPAYFKSICDIEVSRIFPGKPTTRVTERLFVLDDGRCDRVPILSQRNGELF